VGQTAQLYGFSSRKKVLPPKDDLLDLEKYDNPGYSLFILQSYGKLPNNK